MIHVIATIELAPGKRAEFLEEMHAIVPLVLAEEGCIEYGPAVDIETNIDAQGPLRLDAVTVLEKWQDLEALERHLIAVHMLEYRDRVKDLVRSVALQVLEPAAK